ncbi:MAG: TIM barrel protein [Planctomycetota bacterium]
MQHVSRRTFLETTAAVTALALSSETARAASGDKMAFGLVTYLWGQDWDLSTLIANCEKSGALGVELRTTHAHGVEPSLDAKQRAAVLARFADSDVTLVGIGSNERYDDPDPAVVQKAIEATKEFIRLSHDVGSTGVKVKPDRFHPDVPHEKTIEQIGKSLNELGKYADGFGQQIRLEIHGGCAELPTIKAIMDIADQPNVAVCWNSNPQDLQGEGLEHNLGLVRDRFGATCHVRELDSPDYPFQQLIDLLVKIDYDGWILLEASSKPEDRVAALTAQVALFQAMVQKAAGNA